MKLLIPPETSNDEAAALASPDFIWNGTYDGGSLEAGSGNAAGVLDLAKLSTVGAADYDRGIYLSKFHPILTEGDPTTRLSVVDIIGQGLISMPKYAVKRANDKDGKQQTPYQPLSITFRDGGESGPIDREGSIIARKSVKNSFEENDQYLLGGLSCGSFLYLSPINQNSLSVDGPNKFGKKIVEGGSQNAVSVDMVFQYRMTDYHGKDTAGKGRVGGIYGNTFSNLTYSKKIGLDIIDTYKTEFKFDVEVYAKYKATGTNKNSINKVMLQSYRTGTGGNWWFNRRRFFTGSYYNAFGSSRLYDFDARPFR